MASLFTGISQKALKNGKVILVEKGVWDSSGRLPLHLSSVGDSHSVAIGKIREGSDN